MKKDLPERRSPHRETHVASLITRSCKSGPVYYVQYWQGPSSSASGPVTVFKSPSKSCATSRTPGRGEMIPRCRRLRRSPTSSPPTSSTSAKPPRPRAARRTSTTSATCSAPFARRSRSPAGRSQPRPRSGRPNLARTAAATRRSSRPTASSRCPPPPSPPSFPAAWPVAA